MKVYHDTEWGVRQADDRRQFEHLLLETFQAGLSWLTILKKREAFREVFAGFNPIAVSKFSANDVERLMQDVRIIRSRAKIESAVNNAQRFLEITAEFGSFYNFINRFRPAKIRIYATSAEIPAQIPESAAFAVELKTRGFRFIGPVSAYAHMQSVGIVNDHVNDCFRFEEVS